VGAVYLHNRSLSDRCVRSFKEPNCQGVCTVATAAKPQDSASKRLNRQRRAKRSTNSGLGSGLSATSTFLPLEIKAELQVKARTQTDCRTEAGRYRRVPQPHFDLARHGSPSLWEFTGHANDDEFYS
jgi:hypothetical protein